MSIISRLRLNAHLDEAALASLWTDGSLSGAPVSHPHLESCPACRGRFGELASWLEAIRMEGIAEADEHFPAERLAAQHAQVFRRLQAAERPARVIAFPTFAQPLTSRSSHASRWVAAAAAAGLIVGVGVGQLMDLRHSLATQPSTTAADARLTTNARPAPRGASFQTINSTGRDELFLSELDASISRAPARELRALDAFTPRAGDRSR